MMKRGLRSLQMGLIFAVMVMSNIAWSAPRQSVRTSYQPQVSSEVRSGVIAALGTGVLFEQTPNGRGSESRQPFTFRGGYSFGRTDVFLEYQTFSTTDGTSEVQVARDRHEWQVWLKHVLAGQTFMPYIAGAAGFNYEDVDTKFFAESVRESGRPQSVITAAMGLDLKLHPQFSLSLEGRGGLSEGYAPNTQFGLGVFAGFKF